jgi:hypothetical protein
MNRANPHFYKVQLSNKKIIQNSLIKMINPISQSKLIKINPFPI